MPNQKGTIVLMGSGELTATMVEVHKAQVQRLGRTASAVFVDTPAGFQLNADQIADKAREYFSTRVQHPLEVASYKSADEADQLFAEKAYAKLRQADYIFIGPGSPTYAIEQWRKSPIPEIWHQRIDAGGCLVSASAAALTMGRLTLPVYEIYKVGQPPHWAEGLDILGSYGINVAVVPHWNNADGGNHDTRFCFMGRERLEQLEAQLSEDTAILGIDEHTALIIDLDRQTTDIRGIGTVTFRKGGRESVYTRQDPLPIEILKGRAPAAPSEPEPHDAQPAEETPSGSERDEIWESIHALADRVRADLESRRSDKATAAIMELEGLIWQSRVQLEGDMSMSSARDIYRELLASLGGHCSDRPVSAEACLQPVIDAILELRVDLRAQSKWEAADALRDLLLRSGIQVEDTGEGSTWRIKK